MDDRRAGEDDAIARRFSNPFLLAMRPVVGDADLALLIHDHADGARPSVWRAGHAPSEPLPFQVSIGAVLTNDGRWVIDLDDGG